LVHTEKLGGSSKGDHRITEW